MAIESITGRQLNPSSDKASLKTNTAGKQAGAAVNSEQSEDRSKITSVVQEIKKALESTTSEPIFDKERVAALKESISNGTYEIDAEKIAKKMLQFEQ